jgi:predicted transcriptional regulator of viral defense system
MDSKKLTKFIAELHKKRNPISASEIQQLAAKHSITRSIATIMRKAGYANRIRRGVYVISHSKSIKSLNKTEIRINKINHKKHKPKL